MGRLTGRRGPDPKAEHGTRTRYRGNKYQEPCRCADCKDANNVYMRQWYARRTKVRYTRGQNEVVAASPERPATVADTLAKGVSDGRA
jgi:hypothetical protein